MATGATHCAAILCHRGKALHAAVFVRREQAKAVAALTAIYLPHLPFEADQLRMLPKKVVDAAAPVDGPPPIA